MRFKSIVISLVVLLGACGGDVNKQQDAEPLAKASALGASASTEGQVRVRSGTEVTLSGFASDGVDDPLLEFYWEQIIVSGYDYPVEFYERSVSSVGFTAPVVPPGMEEAIQLRFRLTVADAVGETAEDEINIMVLPGGDLNRFLVSPATNEEFLIVVAAAEGTVIDTDIPVEVVLTKTIRWIDRYGQNQQLELPVKQYSGTVTSGNAPAINSSSNLSFSTPLPLLDTDEVNLIYSGSNRSGRLELEDVEDASVSLNITLNQFATGDLQLYVARNTESEIEILNIDNGNTASQLTVSEEWLRQQLEVQSRRSANNYYDCIDPFGEALTLEGWLDQSGFKAYPEEVEHVTYVNNFDLGFGRDMYFREDDNGNVYTYVVNYPNLENALSGRNEFAVVVMEFSEAPTGNCGDGTFTDSNGGEKIVKFYSYVPDEVTGDLIRAPSMNFDGRGERYLPGVCVVCHYGDINTDEFNAENLSSIAASSANLDSSFMLFDLDAFLYSDNSNSSLVDPVYASEAISEELTQNFTREAQENSFRAINQMVLNTFTYDRESMGRFEQPIKAVHGWYGNTEAENLNFGDDENPLTTGELQALYTSVINLPPNDFDGEAYTPSGWRDQQELYHSVYARNCRLCHLQIKNTALDFDSYDEFINHDNLVQNVYERGSMPLSRLTMDRFWVDYFGGTSGAELLREHLNTDANPDNDVDENQIPGNPVAVVSPGTSNETRTDVTLDFDASVEFDGSASLFVDSFSWLLDNTPVSNNNSYTFNAGDPGDNNEIILQVSDSGSSSLVVETSRTIAIRDNTPNPGSTPQQSVNEGETLNFNLYSTLCADAVDSLNCRAIYGDIRAGETPTISISGTPVNGVVNSVNSTTGTISFSSTAALSSGDAQFSFTLTDSFGETSSPAEQAIQVNGFSAPTIGSPDTCTTNATNSFNSGSFPVVFNGGACPNPINNDSTSPSLSLSLVSVSDSSPTNGSIVSINSGNIRYTPPKFFVGNDSFSYTVQDDSLSANQSNGTVVVSVSATQTYSNLSSSVFNACTVCHDGGAIPDWQSYSSIIQVAGNSDSGSITMNQNTSTANLLNSILFQKACNIDSHTGGNQFCTSDGVLNNANSLNTNGRAVLRWIEEGMRNN